MMMFLKKAGAVLAIAVILCGAVPRPARAQFGGFTDYLNLVQNTLTAIKSVTGCDEKECVLDPLAWIVAKVAIQSMTKSMVNWINSGFHGSPAFVSDLEGHLRIVGDAAAHGFLNELASNSNINSPFRSQLVKAATLGYYAATSKDAYFQVNTYTLKNYTTDDKAFLAGDFSKGGWSAWYAAWMNPQNNPYGAQIAIDDALSAQVTATQNKTMAQLNWGQGFLSWCGDVDVNKNGAPEEGSEEAEVTALKSTDPSSCTKKDGTPGQIQTPGSVIQSQLNQTLGLTGNTLVTADEFDEIVGALMSQLVNQVVGGPGLRGVASVSSGGSGFIDQATSPTQLTGGDSSTNVMTTTLENGVASQLDQVKEYRQEWQSILNEAQRAKANIGLCIANDNTGKLSYQQDLDAIAAVEARATNAISSSTPAFTALTDIQAKIAAAKNGTTDALASAYMDAGSRFQVVVQSPSMPTALELAEAHVESQDSTTNGKATLYTQMKLLANMDCSSDEASGT